MAWMVRLVCRDCVIRLSVISHASAVVLMGTVKSSPVRTSRNPVPPEGSLPFSACPLRYAPAFRLPELCHQAAL